MWSLVIIDVISTPEQHFISLMKNNLAIYSLFCLACIATVHLENVKICYGLMSSWRCPKCTFWKIIEILCYKSMNLQNKQIAF